MTNKAEVLQELSENLTGRAQTIINQGHTPYAIMKDAFAEVQQIGNMAGIASIIKTGKLNEKQIAAAERVAVKVLAVLALHKNAGD